MNYRTKEIEAYGMDTVFTFGMYKGKTLREVAEEYNALIVSVSIDGKIVPWVLSPEERVEKLKPGQKPLNTYIDWCIKTIDSFYISEETVEEILSRKSDVTVEISEEAKMRLKEKRERLENNS
jgi:hypothetical protein